MNCWMTCVPCAWLGACLLVLLVCPATLAQQAKLEPYILQEYGRVETGMALYGYKQAEGDDGVMYFLGPSNDVEPRLVSFDGKKWRNENVHLADGFTFAHCLFTQNYFIFSKRENCFFSLISDQNTEGSSTICLAKIDRNDRGAFQVEPVVRFDGHSLDDHLPTLPLCNTKAGILICWPGRGAYVYRDNRLDTIRCAEPILALYSDGTYISAMTASGRLLAVDAALEANRELARIEPELARLDRPGLSGGGVYVNSSAPQPNGGVLLLRGHAVPLLYHQGSWKPLANNSLLAYTAWWPRWAEPIGGGYYVLTFRNKSRPIKGYHVAQNTETALAVMDSTGRLVVEPWQSPSMRATKRFNLYWSQSTNTLWLSLLDGILVLKNPLQSAWASSSGFTPDSELLSSRVGEMGDTLYLRNSRLIESTWSEFSAFKDWTSKTVVHALIPGNDSLLVALAPFPVDTLPKHLRLLILDPQSKRIVGHMPVHTFKGPLNAGNDWGQLSFKLRMINRTHGVLLAHLDGYHELNNGSFVILFEWDPKTWKLRSCQDLKNVLSDTSTIIDFDVLGSVALAITSSGVYWSARDRLAFKPYAPLSGNRYWMANIQSRSDAKALYAYVIRSNQKIEKQYASMFDSRFVGNPQNERELSWKMKALSEYTPRLQQLIVFQTNGGSLSHYEPFPFLFQEAKTARDISFEASGTLYFMVGLDWFSPHFATFRHDSRFAHDPARPFPLVLRRLYLGPDSLAFGGSRAGQVVWPVAIDYDHGRQLRFECAALFYELPKATEYRYRLRGFDDRWSDWSTTSDFDFTGLSEGRYTLEVEARNIYETIGQPLAVSFRIRPPWYRHLLAYLSYGLVVLGLGALFMRQRTRALEREKIRLEQIVSKRTAEVVQQKEEILMQKTEIETQNAEIKAMNDTLESTLTQVSRQRDILEAQHAKIEDSIRYASRIQTAILPDEEHHREHLPPHFIHYLPKDIVSGDFYWTTRQDGIIYLAAVDCTGHGVPGAFMSVLGSNLLHQIVDENGIRAPDTILAQLDRRIAATLRQQLGGENKDGMDVCLVVLHPPDPSGLRLVEYAGAGRPLWHLQGGAITEYKSARYACGGSQHEDKAYPAHRIEVGPHDRLYLFSDGPVDQFGGPSGRKLGSAGLQRFLLETAELSIEEQGAAFDRFFGQWMNGRKQLDDVLIVGLAFSSGDQPDGS